MLSQRKLDHQTELANRTDADRAERERDARERQGEHSAPGRVLAKRPNDAGGGGHGFSPTLDCARETKADCVFTLHRFNDNAACQPPSLSFSLSSVSQVSSNCKGEASLIGCEI